MSLAVRQLDLPGVIELVPSRAYDDRGFFSETWSQAACAQAGLDLGFVQDNHSLSLWRGVLRGLHYQLPPAAQDKLVRVVHGAILDVAVDIRRSSSSFGRWVALEISADKWNQVLVPKGFAHGFLVLEPNTAVIYKVTHAYSREHERAIRFDDPEISVAWPIERSQIHVSAKDGAAPRLAEAEVFC